MKELVGVLSEASRAYYMEDREIMSNFEYDKLYDELSALEQETGVILSNSPTQKVGYEVVSALPKEPHPSPMLSLDKTKDVDALVSWLGDHEGVLSWKLDGLTVVLTYEGGVLSKAVTRGNGEIGEVITPNARTFKNIPKTIPVRSRLTIRGEAIIFYSDFEALNSTIEDAEAKYKNPRNLCSGSVRALNSEVTAQRSVRFYAFNMVEPEDQELRDKVGGTIQSRFEFLRSMGFDTVEYRMVNGETLPDQVKYFSDAIVKNDFPSDGLVLSYNDIAYGRSLGRTAKFPRDSIAFKWQDEEAETTLLEVEWSPSRTGLINPVAIFEPVELEGTVVQRASVHNISILKELALGKGDRIKVYKANMIIPQISQNLTRSGALEIPSQCPACGQPTTVKNENDTETLMCTNPECPAKDLKRFSLFVSRNAMNIDGISEATLESFLDRGFLKKLSDLYHLDRYKDEIVAMDKMGEKSYQNLIAAVEKSRETNLARLIYGLGIPNVGLSNAKLIVRHFDQDPEACFEAPFEELCEIDKIGAVIAESYVAFFADSVHREELDALLKELTLVREESDLPHDLEGKTFVITGSLESYPNRDALKKEIEDRGGKVAGSVSAKTSFLINNDITSTSGKNKKAKELGVPIITEADYIAGDFDKSKENA
ncbi:MAG: NAD-dependent DNA ligase LigA [Eubacterium sp.]|nr:NAD-dependent DNA ligase LigA [Eubacterium sp.]